MNLPDNTVIPWYREPYVWLLITFPALAVVGGIVMINVAVHTSDGLVTDDYYKKGLQINRTLARDKAAAGHGLQASLRLDTQQGQAELQLTAGTDYTLPPYLELHFSHATRGGFDQSLSLAHHGNGMYQAAVPALQAGNWQLQLSADDWRLPGTLRTPGPVVQSVRLAPVL